VYVVAGVRPNFLAVWTRADTVATAVPDRAVFGADVPFATRTTMTLNDLERGFVHRNVTLAVVARAGHTTCDEPQLLLDVTAVAFNDLAGAGAAASALGAAVNKPASMAASANPTDQRT
jgi:hypothetical protein